MHTSEQTEVLIAGELEIRPAEHVARAGGRTLSLSVRELELLAALARREGRIVPREELYETVWGAPHARLGPLGGRLRPQAADQARERRSREMGFIHTHFGFGYRFQPEPSQLFHKSGTTR